MKIKQEHFDKLKREIESTLKKHNGSGELVDCYEKGNFARANKVKDLQKRFCFDVLYGAGLARWASDNLSAYMDDSHIYTALKRICPVVVRKY